MAKNSIWQGSLDMLCGIYCATRLIACYTVAGRANPKTQKAIYDTASRNAFRNLIQSAEDLGYLKARKIANQSVGGYYDNELEKIFNNLSPRKRYNLTALAFTRPEFKALKNSQRRDLVLSFDACAIVQEHGKKHWITIEGKHRDGGYSCFDPQIPDNTARRQKLRWERGLIISTAPISELLNSLS